MMNGIHFCGSAEVKSKKGGQIHIEASGTKFSPILFAVDENKKLEWIGRLGFKGLFDGTHTFELNDPGNGITELIHREQFSGLLVPIFKMKLEKETRLNFQKMNEALKERVEN